MYRPTPPGTKRERQWLRNCLMIVCYVSGSLWEFTTIKAESLQNQLLSLLEQRSGVIQTRTTPYHPQDNGQVERFNRTLLDMLRTLPENEKSRCKDHVNKVVHAYICTRNYSTGYSPFFASFRASLDKLLLAHAYLVEFCLLVVLIFESTTKLNTVKLIIQQFCRDLFKLSWLCIYGNWPMSIEWIIGRLFW
jgi:hypothetical protein